MQPNTGRAVIDYATPKTRRKLVVDWFLTALVVLLLLDIVMLLWATTAGD